MNLICYAGLPGSGKTYAAIKMEQAIGAVRLSRDDIRARLFDTPTYSGKEKQVVFQIMIHLAAYYLAEGKDVILDGMPFSKRAERDAARALAFGAGAKFELYHCTCSEKIALQRIAKQAGDHPAKDRDEKLYYRVRSTFEPFGDDEAAVILKTD